MFAARARAGAAAFVALGGGLCESSFARAQAPTRSGDTPTDLPFETHKETPTETPKETPSAPASDDELATSLLARRRIFLLGDVTDESANALIKRLLWLEATAPGEPIELVINSSGGSLWAGFALLDTMRAVSSPGVDRASMPRALPAFCCRSARARRLQAPSHASLPPPSVHTCCVGRCRSMAAVLLAAGAPGHRHASPSARIMIHQPYWDGADAIGSYSQADDLRLQARESERQRQHWAETLAKLTGADAAALDAKMVRDIHLTAEEARKLGLVDHVGLSPGLAGG